MIFSDLESHAYFICTSRVSIFATWHWQRRYWFTLFFHLRNVPRGALSVISAPQHSHLSPKQKKKKKVTMNNFIDFSAASLFIYFVWLSSWGSCFTFWNGIIAHCSSSLSAAPQAPWRVLLTCHYDTVLEECSCTHSHTLLLVLQRRAVTGGRWGSTCIHEMYAHDKITTSTYLGTYLDISNNFDYFFLLSKSLYFAHFLFTYSVGSTELGITSECSIPANRVECLPLFYSLYTTKVMFD